MTLIPSLCAIILFSCNLIAGQPVAFRSCERGSDSLPDEPVGEWDDVVYLECDVQEPTPNVQGKLLVLSKYLGCSISIVRTRLTLCHVNLWMGGGAVNAFNFLLVR